MKAINHKNPRRKIYLLGNPNVGKSTVFNALTGLKQHTGNWAGKTVGSAIGSFRTGGSTYEVTDLPGTHSVISRFSEEDVTSDEIAHTQMPQSVTLIFADATALKRGITLAIEYLEQCRGRAIFCVNLCDIAQKRGIEIDAEKLSSEIGIPVIKLSAKKKKDIAALKSMIHCEFENPGTNRRTFSPTSSEERLKLSQRIIDECQSLPSGGSEKSSTERIDQILTSKRFGIPIMLLGLAVILWITICGANYPSEWLSNLFSYLKPYLRKIIIYLGAPDVITNIICDGIYQTVTWIISVMLPAMAIFFPLFTLLEDLGVLPRIAFNLDKCYARCNMCGKQCLTQCMGLGCNAVGVVGSRIMPSENQRIISILTNSFIPCNGRFAVLIAISTIFFGGLLPSGMRGLVSMICVLALICLSVLITFPVSLILGKTLFKTENEPFILEMPEYRKPEIIKTLINSLGKRTIRVLIRGISAAAPMGIIIWILANTTFKDTTLLTYISSMLNPIGKFLGVDGFIIFAFILSLPANEITLPILMMGYLSTGVMSDIGSYTELGKILHQNGWTIVTALNMMILTLFHSPCATTLLTVYSETKSIRTVILSIIIPCLIGVILCLIVKFGCMPIINITL